MITEQLREAVALESFSTGISGDKKVLPQPAAGSSFEYRTAKRRL
jgi:hypothetical protein